jgi:hypothetical protein
MPRDLRRLLRHEDHPGLRGSTPDKLLRQLVREMRDGGYVFDAEKNEKEPRT